MYRRQSDRQHQTGADPGAGLEVDDAAAFQDGRVDLSYEAGVEVGGPAAVVVQSDQHPHSPELLVDRHTPADPGHPLLRVFAMPGISVRPRPESTFAFVGIRIGQQAAQ